MDLLEKLKEIRRPIYKTIDETKLAENSQIYSLYLENKLDKSTLLKSNEDPFVIAHFYSKLFDIFEYLNYLKIIEISNISYNVIKKYLKKLNKEEIDVFLLVKNSNPSFNDICFNTLKGELYRINNINLLDKKDLNEFEVLGFCSFFNGYADNFTEVFNLFIKINPFFIRLLDPSLPKVQEAINKNMEYLTNVISLKRYFPIFIVYLDLNSIESNIIAELLLKTVAFCYDKKFSKYFLKLLQKATSIIDLEKFVNLVFHIANNDYLFSYFTPFLFEKIEKSPSIHKSPEILKTLVDLVYILKYHNYYADIPFINIIPVGDILIFSQEYNPTGSLEEIYDLISISCKTNSIKDISLIYCKFMKKILTCAPSFDSILNLPEKFFSSALKRLTEKDMILLNKFHSNLCNTKIKDEIAQLIDKKIFIKYLIKRKIIYDICMSGYEELMDDDYFIRYSEINLKFAISNIYRINEIGFSKMLLKKIQKSDQKNILNSIEINLLVEKDLASNKEVFSYNSHFWDIDSISFSTLIPSPAIQETIDTSQVRKKQQIFDSDAEDQSSKQDTELVKSFYEGSNLSPSTIHLLEMIYNSIINYEKSSEIKYKLKEQEYNYIVQNLFNWTNKSRHIHGLCDFLIYSLPSYKVEYNNFKKIISDTFKQTQNRDLIKNLAISLDVSNISELIRDYSDFIEEISQGLQIKKQEYGFSNNAEFKRSILNLITSKNSAEVIVGLNVIDVNKETDIEWPYLLNSTNDNIIESALKHINEGTYNPELLQILFRRGVLDELSRLILEKLDITIIDSKDMSRIYQLFYTSPLNYLRYEIHKFGFRMNEHISLEVINCMERIFNEDEFEKIAELFKGFEFTDDCFKLMVKNIDTCNKMFKKWIISNIDTSNIDLPYFIKLCHYIVNEVDLDNLKNILKKMKRGKTYDIIEKWAGVSKLECLTRRIYPLRMKDEAFYKQILLKCDEKDEILLLKEVYNID